MMTLSRERKKKKKKKRVRKGQIWTEKIDNGQRKRERDRRYDSQSDRQADRQTDRQTKEICISAFQTLSFTPYFVPP